MDVQQITGKPGLFKISGQGQRPDELVKLVDWTEDQVYDTVEYPGDGINPLPLGDQRQFFQNLNQKQLADTNLTTPRRLPAGTELVLNQIGVLICTGRWNNTQMSSIDFAALCERVHFEFRVNNMTISEGPVSCYPPGQGVTGQTNVGAIRSNGVASPAAIPKLLVPQHLSETNDLQGILTHSAAAWTLGGYTAPTFAAGGALLRCTLRGYIKRAVGKG